MAGTDGLEVTIKYKDIKQTIKGNPDVVTRAYFDVLGKVIPSFDVAASLMFDPNLRELADKLKTLVKFYRSSIIILRQDLTLQDRIILFLTAKLFGHRLNLINSDNASLLEIVEAVGKPKTVTSKTIEQLLDKKSLTQDVGGSYRIDEARAVQFLTNTASKKNSSMTRFMTVSDDERFMTEKNFRPIFSVGYEGRALSELIDVLKQNAIDMLVDVRRDAFSSYAKDFDEKSLSMGLTESHIRYIHIPELGVDYAERQKLKQFHDYEKYFQQYEEYLAKNPELLELSANLAHNNTIAFLCYERDYARCHRHVITDELSKRNFVSVHL